MPVAASSCLCKCLLAGTGVFSSCAELGVALSGRGGAQVRCERVHVAEGADEPGGGAGHVARHAGRGLQGMRGPLQLPITAHLRNQDLGVGQHGARNETQLHQAAKDRRFSMCPSPATYNTAYVTCKASA